MRAFADGVAGWPRTVSPVMLERARLPVAEWPDVAAEAFALTSVAVISPPKSETVCASPDAVAEARAPASVCAEAASEATVAPEPSAGQAQALPNDTGYG